MIYNRRVITYTIFFVILLSFVVMATENEDQIINMNFKGADIRDVLRAISELAEVNLITDGSVNGTISINLKDVSLDKALELITQSQGLAYTWDDNTIVVATPQRIKEIYSDTATETVKIVYADPLNIKNIVTNAFELNIQIDTRNNLLIIYGEINQLNKAKELINKLDVPLEKEDRIVNIVDLESDNIDEIINVLSDFYPSLKINNNGKQLIIEGEKNTVEKSISLINKLDVKEEKDLDIIKESIEVFHTEPEQIKNNISGLYPDLKIVINAENKYLLLEGEKEEVRKALELVKNIDKDNIKITKIMQIDYVDINNLQDIIKKMFADVQIQSNEKRKKIIIYGTEKNLNEVSLLVNKLDIPREQVLIEARIEEISRNELSNIGVSPDELSKINFIKSDDIITGLNISWPNFIQMMEKDGNARTLANPRLMTLNGEKAKLLIGDQIPVEVQKVEDGQAINSIQYIDAGITLEFEPWITNNNQITLNISPKVSSIGESLGGTLPSINTREVETKVRLDDGQTIAIGGLIQDDTIESISKVPFISDIPILGEIFKSRQVSNIQTEVIVFITPHIVKNELEEDVNVEKESEIGNTSVNEKSEKDEVVDNKELNNEDNKNKETKKEKEFVFQGLTREEIDNILSKNNEDKSNPTDLPAYLNILYVIENEDTLEDIADLYNLTLSDIKFINGIKDEVKEGQIITISVPKTHLYRLKKGDTLWKLYKRFGVKVDKIIKVNNIIYPEMLPIGKILIIPEDISGLR